MDDRLGDARAEFGHAFREPARNTTTVQRKIGDSRSFHQKLLSFADPTDVEARSENERQQKKHRNQQDETIPHLLQHLSTSFKFACCETPGRVDK